MYMVPNYLSDKSKINNFGEIRSILNILSLCNNIVIGNCHSNTLLK